MCTYIYACKDTFKLDIYVELRNYIARREGVSFHLYICVVVHLYGIVRKNSMSVSINRSDCINIEH
jgi:hypothetical protein